ncbi:hypothetical protein FRC03_006847 [Tulasnella sp. 419]|nr:hypothetical protein FRC03_006847 [Tulasnella sp. 419]
MRAGSFLFSSTLFPYPSPVSGHTITLLLTLGTLFPGFLLHRWPIIILESLSFTSGKDAAKGKWRIKNFDPLIGEHFRLGFWSSFLPFPFHTTNVSTSMPAFSSHLQISWRAMDRFLLHPLPFPVVLIIAFSMIYRLRIHFRHVLY